VWGLLALGVLVAGALLPLFAVHVPGDGAWVRLPSSERLTWTAWDLALGRRIDVHVEDTYLLVEGAKTAWIARVVLAAGLAGAGLALARRARAAWLLGLVVLAGLAVIAADLAPLTGEGGPPAVAVSPHAPDAATAAAAPLELRLGGWALLALTALLVGGACWRARRRAA